ncbi:hypothetical protein BACINT_00020 [Bacteroides intestinalis DSM 17393]|uniref:Uncharacterized protein n=1 Tax=Bacteroides intestinalis DSM 17393 TaxID=471870 RepID=B3C540_9BACE|nr:hypothetical protein BACINT_00020 [Bacteroides intestinalis DSM 17393]
MSSTAFFKHIICLPQTDGLSTSNRPSAYAEQTMYFQKLKYPERNCSFPGILI